jgi:hypothetical protein
MRLPQPRVRFVAGCQGHVDHHKFLWQRGCRNANGAEALVPGGDDGCGAPVAPEDG